MNHYTQPETANDRARATAFRKMWEAANNGDFGPCDDGPNPGEFEIDWSAINRDFSA